MQSTRYVRSPYNYDDDDGMTINWQCDDQADHVMITYVYDMFIHWSTIHWLEVSTYQIPTHPPWTLAEQGISQNTIIDVYVVAVFKTFWQTYKIKDALLSRVYVGIILKTLLCQYKFYYAESMVTDLNVFTKKHLAMMILTLRHTLGTSILIITICKYICKMRWLFCCLDATVLCFSLY